MPAEFHRPTLLSATPPARVLLCLGPCHGEFYLPLDADEASSCPNDRTHPFAVYGSPIVHEGQPECDACADTGSIADNYPCGECVRGDNNGEALVLPGTEGTT